MAAYTEDFSSRTNGQTIIGYDGWLSGGTDFSSATYDSTLELVAVTSGSSGAAQAIKNDLELAWGGTLEFSLRVGSTNRVGAFYLYGTNTSGDPALCVYLRIFDSKLQALTTVWEDIITSGLTANTTHTFSMLCEDDGDGNFTLTFSSTDYAVPIRSAKGDNFRGISAVDNTTKAGTTHFGQLTYTVHVAAFDGLATFSATGESAPAATTASFDARADFDTTATKTASGTASFDGLATFDTTTPKAASGTASFDGLATFDTTTPKAASGEASFDAVGAFSATTPDPPDVRRYDDKDIPTSGAWTYRVEAYNDTGPSAKVESNEISLAVAAFDGLATFASTGGKVATGEAAFDAIAAFASTGVKRASGAASFGATAALDSTGAKAASGEALFAAATGFDTTGGASAPTATGQAAFTAVASFSGTGTKQGIGEGAYRAYADFSATGAKAQSGEALFAAVVAFDSRRDVTLIHRTALGGRYGPTALKGRDARVTSLGGRVDGSS